MVSELYAAVKRLEAAVKSQSHGDAMSEANAMMRSLQTVIENEDDEVFWVGAAFGTKGRYGTLVGWISTQDTAEREAWIENNFENPWGESDASPILPKSYINAQERPSAGSRHFGEGGRGGSPPHV